jgi:hypothetical protein
MKARLAAMLIRLYPSRWRTEYGEELAELLMQRPLSPGAVLDVVCSAMWQQLRVQEPWLIVGAPLLVWALAFWIAVLSAPGCATHISGKPTWIGVVAFFSVGCWTVLRRGHGGGRAAIKLSMIVTLPFFVVGLLVLVNVVRVVFEPAASIEFRFGSSVGQGRGDVLTMLLVGPVLQIPYAGLIGWAGGLAGCVVRRARRLPQA